MVAFAEQYLYQKGRICYVTGRHVHIVNIKNWSHTERIIDLESLLRIDPENPVKGRGSWKALAYSNGRIVCQRKTLVPEEGCLLILNAAAKSPSISETVLAQCPWAQPKLSFMRVCRDFLWYGLRNRLGSSQRYYWDIGTVELIQGRRLEHLNKPLRIPLQGSEIGSTIVFETFDKKLYGVSTEAWGDGQEIGWASYFYCIRISFSDLPAGRIQQLKLPRRDHNDGVLNDMWSQLSLQQDESDGQVYICESRKEYPDAGSFSTRTNYRYLLKFTEEPTDDWRLEEELNVDQQPPQKRIRRDVHIEHETQEVQDTAPVPSFIIQHVEKLYYDMSSMSMVDLVQQKDSKAPVRTDIHNHLAIRVASRKRKSPYDDPEDPHSMLRLPDLDEETDQPISGSEEDFHPTDFAIFPPDNSPKELTDLLDPKRRSDGRSMNHSIDNLNVVYLSHKPFPGQQGNSKLRPLIIISFDPASRTSIPNLKLLPGSNIKAIPHEEQTRPTKILTSDPIIDTAEPIPTLITTTTTTAAASSSSSNPHEKAHWWDAPAAFIRIEHGYQLR